MNQRVLVNIGQFLILNILYIISIVLSAGTLIVPATSTLFLFIKEIRSDTHDPYSVVQSFFRTLVSRVKNEYKVSLLLLIVIIVTYFNIVNINNLKYPVYIKNIIYYVCLLTLIEAVLNLILMSFLNAYFIFTSNLDSFKMSFFLIHKHIKNTLLYLVVIILSGFLIVGVSLWFIFLCTFSLLYYLITVIYQPVCDKYIVKKEESK